MKLILITGMSGAGKGVALKALEDVGYEAMDNLPLSLIEDVVAKRLGHKVAIDVDIRSREFTPPQLLQLLERLKINPQIEVTTLYLHCDDEVLRKRYTESRRPHPLAQDRPVLDGIRLERNLIASLQHSADLVLDTSETTTAELRRIIHGHFNDGEAAMLRVFITSFSYRLGLPREADLVFDVRFLKNPYYEESLRNKTGMDADVGAYIASDPGFQGFIDKLCTLVTDLLPRYKEEGKRYLTIAIGCTGGKHRSVYTAEYLNTHVNKVGYTTTLAHRDVHKHAQ